MLCLLMGREKLYEGRGRCPLAEYSDDIEGDRGIALPAAGAKGDCVRDRLELGERLRFCWIES